MLRSSRCRPGRQLPSKPPTAIDCSSKARPILFDGTKAHFPMLSAKGITVGWVNVYSGSTTLPNYISGNIIILTGTSRLLDYLAPGKYGCRGNGIYLFRHRHRVGQHPAQVEPTVLNSARSFSIRMTAIISFRTVVHSGMRYSGQMPFRRGFSVQSCWRPIPWSICRLESSRAQKPSRRTDESPARRRAQEAAWRYSSTVNTGFLRAVARGRCLADRCLHPRIFKLRS